MKETIRNYILQKSGKNMSINDTDNIFEIGLVNSLFALQLVTFLEKEFAILVENDDLDLENFNTIDHIFQFVVNKQAKNS
jgi:methoxymalonate biosynthesis acyl carrier protein